METRNTSHLSLVARCYRFAFIAIAALATLAPLTAIPATQQSPNRITIWFQKTAYFYPGEGSCTPPLIGIPGYSCSSLDAQAVGAARCYPNALSRVTADSGAPDEIFGRIYCIDQDTGMEFHATNIVKQCYGPLPNGSVPDNNGRGIGGFFTPACENNYEACPDGFADNGSAICQVVGLPNPNKALNLCGQIGNTNPVDLGTGNKFDRETDYVGQGPWPLRFERFYNSQATQNFTDLRTGFNTQWRHSYQKSVTLSNSTVAATRANGQVLFFKFDGSMWASDTDVVDRLAQDFNAQGGFIGYRYTTADDEIEIYDLTGKLLTVQNRAGLTQTLSYDQYNRIATVIDPFGRTLTFAYDNSSRLATITDPAGDTYTYGYDSNGNLVSVTYPDNKTRNYHYEDTAFKNALTGITDEHNQRFATWTYDASGRAVSSLHAGGANSVTVTYNTDGSATTQDAFNTSRTYTFSLIAGVPANSGNTQPCPQCGVDFTARTFDSNGFIASRTDWNGNRTDYVNDARGLEASRTEGLSASGANTLQTRTITTTYHPSFRLPTLITEPGRTSAMTYDAAGNLLTRTITDTALSRSRTWTYTYNTNGQVLTMDGPRTDVSDVTTYTYYANNDADLGKRGNIATIANALGHVTSITAYNAHGQPLTIVDPNGLTTTLTYDARQRLTSRTVGGELTSYTYDGVGQLTKVTLPDGSFLNYTYDAAHRLTQIADSLGNRIVYTLDAMGNRTQEQVFDPSNALAQTRSRVYNSLNRLTQEIGAQGQSTTYGYDDQGNVTSIDGPLPGAVDVTTNSYDALNRLTRMTDPNAGQVNYAYNALDQMTSVQDPRSLTTSYAYDALNNLNQLASPDTGATQNTYDAAGNLLTQLDAKGQSTSYTYDALNRVTSIAYTTDASLNVTFTYDQGATGKGRLTGVTDSTGTLSYAYDIRGRLTAETRVIGGVIYATGYSYDSAGRLAGMTYPGGRQLSYTRDALGRISGITTTKNNLTQTLLTGVAYRPFGPEQSFTFGNNQTYTRGFDQDGRIAAYTLPNQTLAVGYDSASRITAITDTGAPSNVLTYNYDALDRVTSFNAPALSLNQAFGYDAVGNRTSQTLGANNYTSTYDAASNHIAATTGPTPKSFSFDANGSITNDTVNQYTFDARGRLKQATSAAGVSQFLVNTLGQRVKKSAAGIETVFHYDASGRLIAETDAQGNVRLEYVYLNDIPLAVLK